MTAAAAALAGQRPHVITVNDYLAERDGREMAPIFDFLGLEIGTIVHATPPERRAAAYRARIVYACNKELAFDYLRDRVAAAKGVQPPRPRRPSSAILSRKAREFPASPSASSTRPTAF